MKSLTAAEAERVVESLRYGVPPQRYVRDFTVGREQQLTELQASLDSASAGSGAALLVRANYGAGKSHLLQVLREMALDSGYAVSLVEVNAQEGIRFNRMDTILGAICREMEVDHTGCKGIGTLYDAFADGPGRQMPDAVREARERISSRGKWDNSDYLAAPGVYVALRAWIASKDEQLKVLIEDWQSNPTNYRGQRRALYTNLVDNLRNKFRDPRPEWVFYSDEVFLFHTAGHRQAWDALADFDTIAKAAGLKGFVLLFDEFEDVIQNLNRRDFQEQAFLNLFRFFSGDRFPGMSYFAVTPDFVRKCKQELLTRGLYDFDYNQFDSLAAFEMDPITFEDFLDLCRKIRGVHGLAYDWEPEKTIPDEEFLTCATDAWALPTPDRVRRAVQTIVKALDDWLEVTP